MAKNTLYTHRTGLFGHSCNATGYANDVPYLYYKDGGGIVDGINRMHLNLYFKCDQCNKEVLVAKTHLNKDGCIYIKKNVE